MSFFEITMLLCFGAAWPFSIHRSWKSRSVEGKSVVFLAIVLAGYVAGILHKVYYNLDFVVVFYALNAAMVFTDILLYVRNLALRRRPRLAA